MLKHLRWLAAGVIGGAFTVANAAPEIYTIEPGHTYPSFETPHQGISMWRGKFNKTSGSVWLDRTAQTGRVDILIDTSSANFGLPIMDKVAQSERFLDVAKYPTAHYTSDSITFRKGVPAAIDGQFSLHGVTKPLKLEILSFKCIPHPMLKREVCGADVRAEFDRRDYGLTNSVEGSAMVRLQIEVEALKGEGLPKFGPPPPGMMPPGAEPPAGGPPAGGPPGGEPPVGPPPVGADAAPVAPPTH